MDRRREGGHRERVAVGMADVRARRPEACCRRPSRSPGACAPSPRGCRRRAAAAPPTPALATTTSSPPKPATVAATAASTSSRLVTSQACQGASPHERATSSSSSGSRPAIATRAPRSWRRRASAAPMPRAAPVMNTRRPSSDGVRLTQRTLSLYEQQCSQKWSALQLRPPPLEEAPLGIGVNEPERPVVGRAGLFDAIDARGRREPGARVGGRAVARPALAWSPPRRMAEVEMDNCPARWRVLSLSPCGTGGSSAGRTRRSAAAAVASTMAMSPASAFPAISPRARSSGSRSG